MLNLFSDESKLQICGVYISIYFMYKSGTLPVLQDRPCGPVRHGRCWDQTAKERSSGLQSDPESDVC